MWSFGSTFPELAFDLAAELRATGRADLARELEGCTVNTVSYDPDTDSGWVALEAERGLSAVERQIGQRLGQAINFTDSDYASLQLDNFGRVVAVELVAPPKELRWKIMRLTGSAPARGP
jgi:hypothetical protein